MFYNIYTKALIEELKDILDPYFCKFTGGDEELRYHALNILTELTLILEQKNLYGSDSERKI
jgi:hypothetical protein